MRGQSKAWFQSWAGVAAAAIAGAALLCGIYMYRHRFVRVDADLLALLPSGGTTFFVNTAGLRRAGTLKLLAGSKTAHESDYASFIRETHFDYTTDLDAMAGATDGEQVWMAARGRFDWTKLRQFAAAHGGSCQGAICKTAASKPGRWVSFLEIQPNVLGLALSADGSAAEALQPRGQAGPREMPNEPVWVKLSAKLLSRPMSLPQAVRIFAISLQAAEPVVLSLGQASKNTGANFELRLKAQCPNEATAETLRNQLEIETKMLKLELTRERQAPSKADLTGLLTSGAFQVVHDRVEGTWAVAPELLESLE